ncbi:hypothetical protein B0H15DRAFT_929795 [Mycena belliarum]|uniref:Uncharacterized protein n=1 Tax=Mycena belliarum TaxID=1033014 RepID=A0AAD6U603_9AGAR|nr:hypothetical protein B0H15DRAFT_929795 [Mycena belliae]
MPAPAPVSAPAGARHSPPPLTHIGRRKRPRLSPLDDHASPDHQYQYAPSSALDPHLLVRPPSPPRARSPLTPPQALARRLPGLATTPPQDLTPAHVVCAASAHAAALRAEVNALRARLGLGAADYAAGSFSCGAVTAAGALFDPGILAFRGGPSPPARFAFLPADHGGSADAVRPFSLPHDGIFIHPNANDAQRAPRCVASPRGPIPMPAYIAHTLTTALQPLAFDIDFLPPATATAAADTWAAPSESPHQQPGPEYAVQRAPEYAVQYAQRAPVCATGLPGGFFVPLPHPSPPLLVLVLGAHAHPPLGASPELSFDLGFDLGLTWTRGAGVAGRGTSGAANLNSDAQIRKRPAHAHSGTYGGFAV